MRERGAEEEEEEEEAERGAELRPAVQRLRRGARPAKCRRG